MEAISGSIDLKQNNAELFKTKSEVEEINKKLKVDGKEPVKELGKDEFLKLLITELSHQDPTSPMEDREFIAQMAQFSTLEQMLNFNKNMDKLVSGVSFQSSFNLLGLNVQIEDKNNMDIEGNPILVNGKVESVLKNENEISVRVNGENYPISDITSVEN